jgi:hypothetical protein
MPESIRVMDSHVAADTEREQQLLFIAAIAMMNQQARPRTTTATSVLIALQHAIPQAPEQSS